MLTTIDVLTIIGVVFTIFGAGFSIGYAIGQHTKNNRPRS